MQVLHTPTNGWSPAAIPAGVPFALRNPLSRPILFGMRSTLPAADDAGHFVEPGGCVTVQREVGETLYLSAPGVSGVPPTIVLTQNGAYAASSMIVAPSKSTITRPADTNAYSANDLLADTIVAANVTPFQWTGVTLSGNGGAGIIADLAVFNSGSASFTARVHLFRTAPTVTNGDNGAFAVSNFDLDTYIGYVDVVVDQPMVGGRMGISRDQTRYVLGTGDTIYALLEVLTAFTPASAATLAIKTKFQRLA